jgi:hypothetical protein
VFTGLSTIFALGVVGAALLPVSAAQAGLLNSCTPSGRQSAVPPLG